MTTIVLEVRITPDLPHREAILKLVPRGWNVSKGVKVVGCTYDLAPGESEADVRNRFEVALGRPVRRQNAARAYHKRKAALEKIKRGLGSRAEVRE